MCNCGPLHGIIFVSTSDRIGGKGMDNCVVGERIRGLRLERRMTREELAEAAELSTSFLYEIETGKKGFSAYTLGNLARALGVQTDYILLGKVRKKEEKNLPQAEGKASLDSLLNIQQLLLDAYHEIQVLIDD
jgi:Predicted transcriptional regulators